MCGIAGIFFADLDRLARPEDVAAMVAALVHRGPDGEGIETSGPAALGHRRLSIVDLSEAALQPLANEDGTIFVVCNGEIYNHEELRRELESKGHRFRSRSDSEVIVHLYEEYGPDFVPRLNGMFAFAVWDSVKRQLVLARDRLGQKPLFYRDDPDAFRFASEVFAMHAGQTVERRPNRRALHDYLALGYVPGPRCAFDGAHKLLPGHVLIKRAGEAAVTRSYWSLDYLPKHPAATADDRAQLDEALRGLLKRAVNRRLMSDVPLGAFLSGGVDSSAVVAFMDGSGTKTFSIGFQESAYDERHHARSVAELYRTDHREEIVAGRRWPSSDHSVQSCPALSPIGPRRASLFPSANGSAGRCATGPEVSCSPRSSGSGGSSMRRRSSRSSMSTNGRSGTGSIRSGRCSPSSCGFRRRRTSFVDGIRQK